jgi:hypothetical protein
MEENEEEGDDFEGEGGFVGDGEGEGGFKDVDGEVSVVLVLLFEDLVGETTTGLELEVD